MGGVRIVTDSCACIPQPLVTAYGIIVVPYYVHVGPETFRDLVDVQCEPFFASLAHARDLPKTANPGPGDYLAAYGEAAQDAAAVVSVHMTSDGSGAYQSALVAREMARKEMPDLEIEVVDTRNVAMSHGWIALQAARAAAEGASALQVLARVRSLIPRTRMLQTADTLRYLYMGGRIGRAQHLLGSLLNLKPLISMEDGVIVSLGQARSRRTVYRKIVDRTVSAAGPEARIRIAYQHAAALDQVRELRSMLEERLTPIETIVTELSPALGVHTGPGTVGLCYLQD
jgi:DegV family protein with EDD domain